MLHSKSLLPSSSTCNWEDDTPQVLLGFYTPTSVPHPTITACDRLILDAPSIPIIIHVTNRGSMLRLFCHILDLNNVRRPIRAPRESIIISLDSVLLSIEKRYFYIKAKTIICCCGAATRQFPATSSSQHCVVEMWSPEASGSVFTMVLMHLQYVQIGWFTNCSLALGTYHVTSYHWWRFASVNIIRLMSSIAGHCCE